MAGPIGLHTQDYITADGGSPDDPAGLGPVVFNITTDEDTHSVLLSAVIVVDPDSGEGPDSVQFYRIGQDENGSFSVLGDPVGPTYTLSGTEDALGRPTLILAVDPDPPETGAYVLGWLTVTGTLTFSAFSMTAFTF